MFSAPRCYFPVLLAFLPHMGTGKELAYKQFYFKSMLQKYGQKLGGLVSQSYYAIIRIWKYVSEVVKNTKECKKKYTVKRPRSCIKAKEIQIK